MKKNKFTVVVSQINLLVGDIEGNAERVIQEAKLAVAKHHADLVVFPELTLSSYPPEDLLFRRHFFVRCRNALDRILAAKIPTTIILGYPDKIGMKSFNMAAAIQNGKIIATYKKQKLPNYTVFDEVRYFSPGSEPCMFEIANVKIGLLICEDTWFAEPIQQNAETGAQIIISINASPFDRNKAQGREKMLTQHAQSVHLPIVYANLVGGQDELVFDGGSMVVNEKGERVQQAAYFEEDQMVVEFELTPRPHVIPKPLPPRFSEEENIYKALTVGVRDYIYKNGFPGAILGLSGGIDSALTLAIACDAIGCDKIHALHMPSHFTAKMSIEDSIKQAKIMGVQCDIIDIEPIFKAFNTNLAPLFVGMKPDTTEENLQARIRGTLLMALSNKTGSIVLTTGNKSELSVGYATLYGDMAGGFSVLKDVPKTLVYRLAAYRNSIEPVIPERVIHRAPSAELAADQLDQDTLPPYDILDEIIYRYIEQDEDPEHIYSERLNKKLVDHIVAMINRNEYKRRQAPIGIRTTERAFGKDRRYPITSGYVKSK